VSDQMPHDDELRALYRKLPADEPPATLDDTILQAARRGSALARRQNIVRRLRLAIPLAAAAGVVLTLTLTRLTPEQRGSSANFEPPSMLDGLENDRETMPTQRAKVAKDEGAATATKEALKTLGYMSDGSPAADSGNTNSVIPQSNSGVRLEDSTRDAAVAVERARPQAPPPASGAPLTDPPAALSAAQPSAAPPAKAELHDDPVTPSGSADIGARSSAINAMKKERAAAAAPAEEAVPLTVETRPAPVARPPVFQPWPFNLEPGLTAEETCRRVKTALKIECTFHAGFVELLVSPPVAVDRGPHAGKSAERLTLVLHDGKLKGGVLFVKAADGSLTPEGLTAPSPAADPKPER